MVNGIELSINSFPIELQLLLTIIRKESASVEQEIRSLLDKSIDWDKFVQLAFQHRVYPVAASNILSSYKSLFPIEVTKQLNQMYMHNTYSMLRLTASMEQLCKDLESNGIKALVLKGPVLAEALYGEFSLRTSKDIDLLVPEQEFERAESILLQHGYKPDKETTQLLKSVIRKRHNLPYTHPDTGVQVELHWRMSSNTYKEPSFSELWQRKRTTTKTNFPVYYLGQEDLFVYLVLHGALHGWFRLRWLADIDLMLRRTDLNWAFITESFRMKDSMHVLVQSLLLSDSIFRSPIESSGIKNREIHARSHKLAKEAIKMINEHVHIIERQTPEELKAYIKGYKTLLMSPGQKWRQMLSRLYPSSYDAELLPLPKWLHFMYFPLRPFLWAWRKKKQRAAA
ncbi:nucleotidyltransferase family protein [Paenibacillus sp. PR3]|uniref:Nucleotidyltransferase family protein n=1 Tax=Paenibacillus terricola TaxID=2763503 RepID=A0ABR8MZY9_9BACL|nr:nucleotidyltransferase family protein [Paenibacillus terricola]MBD3921507.1 nucleotidyltransferase family protein [Paenibacillus terricola]